MDGRYDTRTLVFSVADLELINSALLWYAHNVPETSRRRTIRRSRAAMLAYNVTKQLGGNWEIDEDGTGRTVEVINGGNG